MTQAAYDSDPTQVSELALALNIAMGASENARAAYLATYGEEWAPLGGSTIRSYAESTFVGTVR